MNSNQIYRTEVIWKPEPAQTSFDPEDTCPIEFVFFFSWPCLNYNNGRKKMLLRLFAVACAILIVAVTITNSSASTTSYEIKQSWNAEQSSNNEYYDVLHKPNAISLPKIVDDDIADVEEPWTEGDVTYFFHIPRTAGASVKDVSAYINISICLDRLDIINNSQ